MLLSVIVTIVDGGAALERCLDGLARQQHAPPLEVIVPWDDTVPGIDALRTRYPAFHFLALHQRQTARPAHSHAGQHELFDRRRAAGLGAATGEIVAILEDRGVPRADWARTLHDLHGRLPHAAIGGAIENGRTSIRHWAVYFCDFGRFGLPFEPGPRAWVSDINIAYKRRALEQTAHLWKERYHETTVNWALAREGEVLFLSPEPVVDQLREPLAFGGMLRERIAWGRLFAATRAEEAPLVRRLALVLGTPLLPLVLLARHARLQLPRRPGTFLASAPLLVVLLIAWSAGEALGYITADA
ncbi:MAG: hypothetical protein AB7H96_05730 [Vicinamibacterales bacterium]